MAALLVMLVVIVAFAASSCVYPGVVVSQTDLILPAGDGADLLLSSPIANGDASELGHLGRAFGAGRASSSSADGITIRPPEPTIAAIAWLWLRLRLRLCLALAASFRPIRPRPSERPRRSWLCVCWLVRPSLHAHLLAGISRS